MLPHLTFQERQRREQRKGSYHLVASRNKLPITDDPEEENEDLLFRFLLTDDDNDLPRDKSDGDRRLRIRQVKTQMFRDLARTSGDVTTAGFLANLERLIQLHDPSTFDARKLPRDEGLTTAHSKKSPSKRLDNDKNHSMLQLEGMWISLSKPKFEECLGMNDDGEFLYTLGRMTFDMFRPGGLVCGIQGTFNPIHVISQDEQMEHIIPSIPQSFMSDVRDDSNLLRSYNIVTALTIEPGSQGQFGPDSPNQMVTHRLEGLMTTYGYALPNPDHPNRLSIWFTGGSLEVNDADDLDRWKQVFGSEKFPKRKWHEQARVFGAQMAMGAQPAERMESDGKMSYQLTRPIGGHEKAHMDILYLDSTLRITRCKYWSSYYHCSFFTFTNISTHGIDYL
jgi:hypothetical protein